MPTSKTISPEYHSLENLFDFFKSDLHLELSEAARAAIQKSRAYLESRLSGGEELIYGINTGFGSLCNVGISSDQLEELQTNLVLSHACGVGDLVPQDISKLIFLLKIKNLSFGYSGVREELIDKMVSMYNAGIVPLIYQQGSLGASGDLAPLAHMSLPLIGEGEVWKNDRREKATTVLEEKGIEPLTLSFKEGLALLNGTQFSLSYGVWSMYHAKKIMSWANVIAGMSLEAYFCSLDPFEACLHDIRNQNGQKSVATDIRRILFDSEIMSQEKHSVQDPYSFRCIPQVHGASSDCVDYVYNVLENELNAVTDNPNVFANEGKVLSGGNFHAQPLALALDFLAMGLAELGNISERRTYKLINGDRGLPEFLTPHAGLQSGLMIAQYTAASVVSQNKQLCTPSSVDSITSSKGQEDHVSMAANGATKLYKVVENTYKVLAIELLTAAQAIEFRRPLKSSPIIQEVFDAYRQVVPKIENDRIFSDDIHKTIDFLKSYES